MRSIQTKLIVLMMTGIFLSSVLIGGLGLWFAVANLKKDSETIIGLTADKDAAIINRMLDSVVQGAETIADYAIDNAENIATIVEKERRDIFTKDLEKVMINAANNVLDVRAVYIRYAPEITAMSEGLFYVKDSHGGKFKVAELTDITKYSSDDVEHVGWYYIPKANGEPTWMEPYYNRNININMISYVIPLYKDGSFIGVAGMDIDFDCITREIDAISVYNTGYAFLVDHQGRMMHHHDQEFGSTVQDETLEKKIMEVVRGEHTEDIIDYTRNGKDKKMSGKVLTNGMCLFITAPSEEINAEIWDLMTHKIAAMCIVLIIFFILMTWCARSFVKPIRELNKSAQRVIEGDLNIDVKVKSRDEVGELANSLRLTVNYLKEYIDYINGIAYTDTLTEVKSNASYLNDVKQLDEKIQAKDAEFAVIVADINGLKTVNDTYGHDEGDRLIKNTAYILCEVFSKENTYRMGGDEFVVILTNEKSEDYEEYMNKLDKLVIARNEYISDPLLKISIACGGAMYNPEKDICYRDVFKRADDAMYINKAKIKSHS